MAQPLVYIVILNWNGWKDTIECLESVFKQSYRNYFIFVLDNHSADQSFNRIADWLNGSSDFKIDAIQELRHLSSPEIKKPVSFRTRQAVWFKLTLFTILFSRKLESSFSFIVFSRV